MNSFNKVIFGILLLFMGLSCACKQNNIPQSTIVPGDFNEPLPKFLTFVSPEPQETIPLASYEKGEHYTHSYILSTVNVQSSICTEIVPKTLLEPGDFFASRPNQGEFLPDRITAYLDDTKLERSGEVVTILGLYHLWDENNNIIAEAPGPQIICWFAKAKPGKHIASIEIRNTSETVRYSWLFEITEN